MAAAAESLSRKANTSIPANRFIKRLVMPTVSADPGLGPFFFGGGA